MVSSSLNTLRGTPQKQADIYNAYLPKAAKVRMDNYLSGPARLAQLERMVTSASNALQGLQDSANAAETAIRNKAAALIPSGPASEVGEGVRDTIRDGYKNGLNLSGMLDIIVKQGDRPALAALKSLVPYYEKDTALAMRLIAAKELQLYSRDELAALAETYELDASMTPLRNNFKTLFAWFTDQLRSTSVAGMFMRLDSLYPWYGMAAERRGQVRTQGLIWDALPQDRLLLANDFDRDTLANLAPLGGA